MKKLISSIALLTILGVVSSCGQSSGGDSSGTSADQNASDSNSYNDAPEGAAGKLTGTAAVGAPIPNGIVKVRCSDQQLPDAATDAFGKWSVDVQSCDAPYLIRVKGSAGGKPVDLLSAADSDDVGEIVNVTPLTHMIVANVIGSANPEEFESEEFDFTKVSKEKIKAQEAKVKTALSNVIKAATGQSDISDLDLMNTPFSTDHSGLDAVLDVLKVEVSVDGKIEVNLSDGTNVINSFTPSESVSVVVEDVDTSKVTNIVQSYSGVNSILKNLIKYVKANATSISQASSSTGLPAGYGDLFHSDFLDMGRDELGALHRWFRLNDLSDYQEMFGSSELLFTNINLKKSASDPDKGLVFFDIILDGELLESAGNLSVAKEGENWKLYGDQIPYDFEANISVRRRFTPSGVSDIIQLEAGFNAGAQVGTVTQVRFSTMIDDVKTEIATIDVSYDDTNDNGSYDEGEPATISDSTVLEDGAYNHISLEEAHLAKFNAGHLGEYILEFLDEGDAVVGDATTIVLADPNLYDHSGLPSLTLSSDNFTESELTSENASDKVTSFCGTSDISYDVSLGDTDLSLNYFYGQVSVDQDNRYEYEQDYSANAPSLFSVNGTSSLSEAVDSTYKFVGLYLRDGTEVEYALELSCE